MQTPIPARAVVLCGTEQPDAPGRILSAGPLTVELDNGALRYLKVNGVEALRAIAFLVRDENWGTYVPKVSKLEIDQRADGFSVSYHAVCARASMEIAFDIVIRGRADGSLDFDGTAVPGTDFVTARTGFVVLHPLGGVVGHALEVEHVDGTIEKSEFPKRVNPIQPFLNIRSLSHEVLPGVRATVRMEGDTWEMEDHRNWTDASFKTYVRPLSLPWPYTLKAGEPIKQSIRFSLAGAVPKPSKSAVDGRVEVKLGAVTRKVMPPLGLGMPAEEIGAAAARMALLKGIAPRLLACHFDPREKHGSKELYGYRLLCEETGADCVLEVVVASLDRYAEELDDVARLVREAGLKLAAVAVCPVGDLKSVLPAGDRPPAPPLDKLYAAARAAFPGIRIGGGMFSFFTELNRKHPPVRLLDFVTNTTCPIVHAADDRSVMETHEALPWQMATARSFIGKTAHRVGPSAIGCRDNPHGATHTPNPHNERVCLAKMDPRQRGLFGASWLLAYIATLAREGAETIAVGAPTGPLGFIHRPTDYAQPGFDGNAGRIVYPAYHVVSGLARAAGAKLVSTASSAPARVASFAYRGKGGTILWLANMTADRLTIALADVKGATFAAVLDESSFGTATAAPARFQGSWKAVPPGTGVGLGAYAVAVVSIND
ncbi:MAG: hypothetical protein ABI794_17460 [Betaproteobacteria bacterium]